MLNNVSISQSIRKNYTGILRVNINYIFCWNKIRKVYRTQLNIVFQPSNHQQLISILHSFLFFKLVPYNGNVIFDTRVICFLCQNASQTLLMINACFLSIIKTTNLY